MGPATKPGSILGRLEDRVKFLAERDGAVRGGSNALIRGVVDFASGADNFHDTYSEAVEKGREDLSLAKDALGRGDTAAAERYLKDAGRFIDRAELFWGGYVRSRDGESRSFKKSLNPLDNAPLSGSAAIGAGGVLFAVGAPVAAAIVGAVGIETLILSLLPSFSGDATASNSPEGEGASGPRPPENDAVEKTGVAGERETTSAAGKNGAKKITVGFAANTGDLGPVADVRDDAGLTRAEERRLLKSVIKAIDEALPEGMKPEDAKKAVAKVAEDAKQQGPPPVSPDIHKLEFKPAIFQRFGNLTQSEMEKVAREALTEWQSNPAAAHDYGSFLLAIEAQDAGGKDVSGHFKSLQDEWFKRASAYRETAVMSNRSAEGKAESVMKHLYADGLGKYRKKYALLMDFLEGRGGNCDTNSQYVFAAMASAGVKLTSPWVFGVQIFKDHKQPVAYNRETGVVWDLMSGQRTTKIAAPIYDPHIYYHSYLTTKNADVPFDAGKLLIVERNKSLLEQIPILSIFAGKDEPLDIKTNFNLNLPEGSGVFSNAPIPESAEVPSPYGAITKEDGPSLAAETRRMGMAVGDFAKQSKAISDHIKSEAETNGFSYSYVSRSGLPGGPYSWTVVFNEASADTRRFNALPTSEDKRDYLIHIFNRNLLRRHGADIELLANLLARPSDFEKYDPERVKAAFKNFATMKDEISGMVAEIGTIYLNLEDGRYTKSYDYNVIADLVESRNPLLNLFFEKRKAFQERLGRNPAEFILFADRLSDEKRRAFLEFLDFAGTEGENTQSEAGNVSKISIPWALKAEGLIGLKEKERAGRRAQAVKLPEVNPLDGEYIEIDIDLAVGGLQTDKKPDEGPLPQQKKGRIADVETRGRKGRKEETDEEVADTKKYKYRISPRTMIDFLLKYHYESDSKRPPLWSPRLSRELARINEDGSYDDRILEAYPDLILNYPEAEKVVANPLYARTFGAEGALISELAAKLRDAANKPPKRDEPPLIPPDFEMILRPIALRKNAALLANLKEAKEAIENNGPKSGVEGWGAHYNPYQK